MPDDWKITPCIIWTGAITGANRGSIQIDKKQYSAHRLALMLKLGRHIKMGMQANHFCDNSLCVNPLHLYEGSQKQNRKDCLDKNRDNLPNGEQHWNAKHNKETIIQIRKELSEGITFQEIANRHNTTVSYVNKIKRKDIWKWLED